MSKIKHKRKGVMVMRPQFGSVQITLLTLALLG